MVYNTAEKLPIRQWRVSRKCNINCIKYSARFLKQGTILRAENLCEMFLICYTAAEASTCSCLLRKKKYLNI